MLQCSTHELDPSVALAHNDSKAKSIKCTSLFADGILLPTIQNTPYLHHALSD